MLSNTIVSPTPISLCFTQVVIYIALKLGNFALAFQGSFTQVVIYIALKHWDPSTSAYVGFTQVVIYIALKP